MTTSTLQRGTSFRLLMGDGATPTEAFTLVCIATTLKFDQKVETDDAMVPDCTSPDNIPTRQSVVKGQTFDLAFSGKADFSKFKAINTVFTGGAVRNFQVFLSGTGANGGGTYQGGAIITDLSIDKNENGMVSFSCALKGQGNWPFTAAA